MIGEAPFNDQWMAPSLPYLTSRHPSHSFIIPLTHTISAFSFGSKAADHHSQVSSSYQLIEHKSEGNGKENEEILLAFFLAPYNLWISGKCSWKVQQYWSGYKIAKFHFHRSHGSQILYNLYFSPSEIYWFKNCCLWCSVSLNWKLSDTKLKANNQIQVLYTDKLLCISPHNHC